MTEQTTQVLDAGRRVVKSTPDIREPKVRTRVLTEAERLVSGPRAEQYGGPQENFGRIAALWRTQFGWDVSASDVALAMILLKVARAANDARDVDTWTDIAGYAGLGAEVSSGD